MYLKSLEVHGFKSFANKLVFEFHNGITGIVGPNGSGKSNVADAVRWVLGEQSAGKLRGSNMQDVIFAGTETRRPVSSAYVAITFSNEDHKLPVPYEEVTVARRVYRSGESEYLLNGATCRLKDIQEMLFDTGIGKEGYSIIGQGQIDRILSVKSEERRELFDEAAGIVKYKKRKTATEKNLAEEEQNMARAGDILKELEAQAGPVNEEAEKARKYLSLKDDLKKYDVNVFLFEYDKKKSRISEIEENEKIMSADCAEKNKGLQDAADRAASLEDKISENEKKKSGLSRMQGDINLSLNNSENQIRILNEQIKNAEDNEEHFNERREEFEKAEKQASESLKKYNDDREDALKNESDLRKKREELNRRIHEERLSIRDADKKIENAEKSKIDYINSSAGDRAERQKYITLLEQNRIQKAHTAQRLLKNKTTEDELTRKMSDEKEEADDILDKLDALKDLDSTIKESIAEIKKNLLDAEREHNDIQSEFHIQNSRLLSVRNMAERYDGFGQSIRRVMEQKKNNSGIVGVVADVIGAPEKYETAVETALGGQIQNIVTDTQQTAKAMIGFLKKNKYGRATFLPLDTIVPGKSSITEEVLREKGAIGAASDLAVYDQRFKILARYLLGRVLVVDNIDNAIAIGNKYRHTLRMVTLEGDILNPGGSMSGGTYRNSSSLLGRRREIESLEKKLADVRERMSASEKKNEELQRTLSREQDKIAGNEKLRNDLNLQLNSHKMNYDRAEEDLEKLYSERDSINSDKSLLEASEKDINKKIDEIDARLKERGYTDEDYEKIRTDLLEEKKKMQKELSSMMDEGIALDRDITTSTNNAAFAGENISRTEEELKQTRKSLDALIKENRDFGSVLSEKNEAIEKEKENIAAGKEKLAEIEKQIKAADDEEKSLKEKNKNAVSEKESLIREISGLERESDRLSALKEKLEEEISSYIDYMWEEYEITYNDAAGMRSDEGRSYQEMKNAVKELRQQIKALGNVNVNSIEKSREINERYGVLSAQYDDIVKAKESLEKIISDLDQKMQQIFTEQFARINESFNIVFKEMFGGGKGSIRLDDDSDVLSSGVTIIAQPPGKKLQNMMQMSGGEKALTAISLLFAIQRLKPSPFCLLDEIEAALDDSNVVRFAEYLHKLTSDTQFIVITHRRGTMNAADRLYGITMQEKGVSTLISVDLVEADKLIQDDENKEYKA